jgi:hypothetical protein
MAGARFRPGPAPLQPSLRAAPYLVPARRPPSPLNPHFVAIRGDPWRFVAIPVGLRRFEPDFAASVYRFEDKHLVLQAGRAGERFETMEEPVPSAFR